MHLASTLSEPPLQPSIFLRGSRIQRISENNIHFCTFYTNSEAFTLCVATLRYGHARRSFHLYYSFGQEQCILQIALLPFHDSLPRRYCLQVNPTVIDPAPFEPPADRPPGSTTAAMMNTAWHVTRPSSVVTTGALDQPTGTLHNATAPADAPPLRSQAEFLMTGILPVSAPPDATCSTCLELLTDDVVKMLACGHMFHCTCILPWFQSTSQQRGTCPNCRTELFEPEPLRAQGVFSRLTSDQGVIGRGGSLQPLRPSFLSRQLEEVERSQRLANLRERLRGDNERASIQSERSRRPVPAGLRDAVGLPFWPHHAFHPRESAPIRETMAQLRTEIIETLLGGHMLDSLRQSYEEELALRRTEAISGAQASTRATGNAGSPYPEETGIDEYTIDQELLSSLSRAELYERLYAMETPLPPISVGSLKPN